MISINSNIAAMRLQRIFGESSAKLGISFERLSSGQRINRASDDAAGLAVADQLRVQSRLYSGASRNVNDAISAINIASSTLGDQTLILERMLELAEQSANGSYSSTQRLAMMKEYRQLSLEFGRLGDSTKFNGLSLLLGGRGSNLSRLTIQTGITGSTDSTIGVSLGDSGTLSGYIREGYAYGSGIAPAGFSEYTESSMYSINGSRLARFTVRDAYGAEKDIMIALEYSNGTYTAAVFQNVGDTGVLGGLYQDGSSLIGNDPTKWVRIANQSAEFTVSNGTGKVNGSGFARVSYSFDSNKDGSYESNGSLTLDLRGLTFYAPPSLGMFENSTGSNSGVSNIDFTGIETTARALDAITVINNRLVALQQLNGQFGATQSRLEQALAVVSASREVTKAAESLIRDADIAAETARLTAQQILQQMGSNVMRRAARLPELALELLRPPER